MVERNKLENRGETFVISFAQDSEEPYHYRRLEITNHGLSLLFRDMDTHQYKVLREVEIPVAVLFEVWPTLKNILTILEPGDPQ